MSAVNATKLANIRRRHIASKRSDYCRAIAAEMAWQDSRGLLSMADALRAEAEERDLEDRKSDGIR